LNTWQGEVYKLKKFLSNSASHGTYYSTCYDVRTIGMFEQNNIGVRCEHPLAVFCNSLEPHSAMVSPLLAAVEKISQYLEGP
jgi:hypothetical protein